MRPASTSSVALHDLRTGETRNVASPAAPLPPRPVPGQAAFSFTRTDSLGAHQIVRVEHPAGAASDLGPALLGRTSHVWSAGGWLIMGRGNALFARRPEAAEWTEIARFRDPLLQQVTAYAVSPSGDRIVILSPAQPPLATVVSDSIQSRGLERGLESIRAMAGGGELSAYAARAEGFHRLAADLARAGRPDHAIRVLELAVELMPEAPSLREHLEALSADQSNEP